MEDLLASIRKAIHDDIGEAPATLSGQSAGTLYKNSMRELHVRAADDTGAAAEIQELRDKINRNREADAQREMSPPPALRVSRDIDMRRPPRAAEPVTPPLRHSLAEPDAGRFDAGRRDFTRRLEREIEAQPIHHGSSWQEPEPPPAYMPRLEHRHSRDAGLLGPEAEAAAGAAFSRLAGSLLNRATGDRSIEEMTRDLLRGMLKQWLDENLPSLVERLVREEIERVARRGR